MSDDKDTAANKPKVEPYYQSEARSLVYLLFDNGFLSDRLTRASLDWLEEYVGFLFQSRIEMSIRAQQLLGRSASETFRPLVIRGTASYGPPWLNLRPPLIQVDRIGLPIDQSVLDWLHNRMDEARAISDLVNIQIDNVSAKDIPDMVISSDLQELQSAARQTVVELVGFDNVLQREGFTRLMSIVQRLTGPLPAKQESYGGTSDE